MRIRYLLTAFFTLFLVLSAQAEKPETYSVVTRLAILDDTKSGLNSDKKLRLQAIANSVGVNPTFFIASPDKVRIISQTKFDAKEIISDVKTQQFSKEVRRIYNCALVEVLTGPSVGKRGWTVISRETVDRFTDTYLTPDDVEPETQPQVQTPETETRTPRR